MKDRADALLEEKLSPLFQPDGRRYHPDAVKSDRQNGPERVLLLAVLADGIRCFQGNAAAASPAGKTLFAEAEEWIFDTEAAGLFSFENICAAWELDPRYLRLGLLRWKEKYGNRPVVAPLRRRNG
ncbi:MAG TPA: hypothetical protein VGA73_01975 [Candidatus Binatia bacterium]